MEYTGKYKDIEIVAGNEYTAISAAEFDNCVLQLSTRAKLFTVVKSRFQNCKIFAKKDAVELNFRNVFFQDCIFVGRFEDCRFGAKKGEDVTFPFVQSCDFSDASLCYCQFSKFDLLGSVLPINSVRIVRSKDNLEKLKETQWPDNLDSLVFELLHGNDQDTVLIFDLEWAMKEYEFDFSSFEKLQGSVQLEWLEPKL